MALPGIPEELLVLYVGVLGGRHHALLAVFRGIQGSRLDVAAASEVLFPGEDFGRRGSGGDGVRVAVLDDGIVGDLGFVALGVWGSRSLEEKRTLGYHPPPERVVLPDNPGVDEGNKEEGSQEGETEAGTKRNGRNVPWGLLVETESRRAFVDDRERADSAGNQEKAGGGVDSPRQWILAHVNHHLDKHENGSSKAGRNKRSHGQAGEDGTETGALVPAPLYVLRSNGGDTDTSNRRNEGVGRGNVS